MNPVLGTVVAVAVVALAVIVVEIYKERSRKIDRDVEWMLGDHPTAHEPDDESTWPGEQAHERIERLCEYDERLADSRYQREVLDTWPTPAPGADPNREIDLPGLIELRDELRALPEFQATDHHRITSYPFEGPVTHTCSCGKAWPCDEVVAKVWEDQR